jgi:hypothetical protein
MPITPGLSGNLRLNGDEPKPMNIDGVDVTIEQEGPKGDTPELDQQGNVLRIDHGDGSISVSLDGKPIEEAAKNKKKGGWFENLADEIEDLELGRIASDLIRGVKQDMESRKEWIEERAQGLRLLGLKVEIPGLQGSADGAPIEGMSKVRDPLLLEAVLRFQANARSELLPTDGPMKVRIDGNSANPDTDDLAGALEKDMNHYLTVTATEYYPDTDRMLFLYGFGGTGVKKVYYCPLRNRPVSESIDAEDFIVNNTATDLANAKRITQRVMMRPSVVKRMQIIGAYRDVQLSQPMQTTPDSAQLEKANIQGVQTDTFQAEDRDRELYEICCELDIKGFEHKIDGDITGLEIPYVVTIDVSSKQILAIRRNFNEDDQDLPEARRMYVKFPFVPGLGFYDIGLLHMLGNTTNAITAGLRELLDAGMYANFPGFLYSDVGSRQNSNIFRVPPGGGAQIKTGGQPISDVVMPLPYKEPSATLMTLIEAMRQTGQRVGGTAELPVGEGKQDAPVGTTIALIEQATKVMNSVHKRMHAAQAEEFQLLVDCFKEHPESFWQRNKKPAKPWDEQLFLKCLEDYHLVPQADPNTASHMQRMMKINALSQLAQQAPQFINMVEVVKAELHAMGWDNYQRFMTPPGPPPPDPKEELMKAQAQAALMSAKAKAAVAAHKMSGPPDTHMSAAEMMDAQSRRMDSETKHKEVQIRAASEQLEAQNRAKDRESREMLAAAQLAKEIAQHPETMDLVKRFVSPEMLQKLQQPS